MINTIQLLLAVDQYKDRYFNDDDAYDDDDEEEEEVLCDHLQAVDQYWHEDCLKCGCCDCRLGEVSGNQGVEVLGAPKLPIFKGWKNWGYQNSQNLSPG